MANRKDGTVDHITFSVTRRHDKELIAKLNAVRPYYYDDVTSVARRLLHEKLDEVVRGLGISVTVP